MQTVTEQEQQELFDRIHDMYVRHYSDNYSREYIRRFFVKNLLGGIEYSGTKVLEAMCGSGQITEFLLSKGANVTGLDISPGMLEHYSKRWPGCATICSSLLDCEAEDEAFDHVIIMGGLHHLHPNVQRAVDEIYRILKPGGFFCFSEPHAGSLPDIVRKLWYKMDTKLVNENEKSIDLEDLIKINSGRFEISTTKYLGNLAYLFVYSSMFFRVPPRLKRSYAPILLWLESPINIIQGKRLSCFCIGQWRKQQGAPACGLDTTYKSRRYTR